GQKLPDLDETGLSESSGIGSPSLTRWYANFGQSPVNQLLGNTTIAKTHCDGTPITDGAQMVRVDGNFIDAPKVDWNNDFIVPDAAGTQDVNFNGIIDDINSPLQGFNDWANIDLRQIAARGGAFGLSGAGGQRGGAGGQRGGAGGQRGGAGGQ